MSLPTFAHIVNPVMVDDSSDLLKAQPVTFESMRIAQTQAAGSIEVELLAVGYAEDAPVMPQGFKVLPPLSRSVLDVATFEKKRKLPLLVDILERQFEGSESDYFIFTNVDIGLQPDFYLAVQSFIKEGYDTFVINRRTIPDTYSTVEELPQMWAEEGEVHRGWDCFVFPREWVPQFELGSVTMGATRVGLALLSNMVAFGTSFHEFHDSHLTFHIGDERSWKNPEYSDYDTFNTRELVELMSTLEEIVGPFDRKSIPGSFLWRKRRLGPLYELWSRYVTLPPRLSRLVNSLLRE